MKKCETEEKKGQQAARRSRCGHIEKVRNIFRRAGGNLFVLFRPEYKYCRSLNKLGHCQGAGNRMTKCLSSKYERVAPGAEVQSGGLWRGWVLLHTLLLFPLPLGGSGMVGATRSCC
jgi:chitinase